MVKRTLLFVLTWMCCATGIAAPNQNLVPPPDSITQLPPRLFAPPAAASDLPGGAQSQSLPAPQGMNSEPVPMAVEQRLSDIECRLAAQERSQPVVYGNGPPPEMVPFEDTPAMASIPRGGHWEIGFEIGPSNVHLAGPDFGQYVRPGATFDINVGFELDTGYGFRADLWGFVPTGDESQADIDVSASTFETDIYKRFAINYSSLTVGAGGESAFLDFREIANDRHCQFNGAGVNVFGAVDHPIYIGQKWDIAFVGLGRMSILEGQWRDHTGDLVPDTNNDMMTIFEASWGMEFRRHFGRNLDKFCYFDVMADIQDWQSSWMTANVGSSAGFYGVNFSAGVSW